MGDMIGNFLHLPLFTLKGYPLYKVHQLKSAVADEP